MKLDQLVRKQFRLLKEHFPTRMHKVYFNFEDSYLIKHWGEYNTHCSNGTVNEYDSRKLEVLTRFARLYSDERQKDKEFYKGMEEYIENTRIMRGPRE